MSNRFDVGSALRREGLPVPRRSLRAHVAQFGKREMKGVHEGRVSSGHTRRVAINSRAAAGELALDLETITGATVS
jgi:hypothetical protein